MSDKLYCAVCEKEFDTGCPVSEIFEHLKTHSLVELVVTVYWSKFVRVLDE